MKVNILAMEQRSAASRVFARLIPALVSLPLCFAAGCALDEPGETATTTQALGRSCTMMRPIGWAGAANECSEARSHNTTITLPDGGEYFTFSAPGPGLGDGEVTVICTDGVLSTDPWDTICIPDQGGGGGEPF